MKPLNDLNEQSKIRKMGTTPIKETIAERILTSWKTTLIALFLILLGVFLALVDVLVDQYLIIYLLGSLALMFLKDDTLGNVLTRIFKLK